MFHLITGGSASGKSAYAEALAVRRGGSPLIYIATMIPYGAEGRRRIERHLKLRRGKNFETVERYRDLRGLTVPKRSVLLLEDISNLVANEMFEEGGRQCAAAGEDAGRNADAHGCAWQDAADAVCRGVLSLSSQAEDLFAVTDDVFCAGLGYDDQTVEYMSCMADVNRNLALNADLVTEVVYGIPVPLKESEF